VSVARKPDVNLPAVRAIAAAVLPGSGRPLVERTARGVSTQVYRLRRGRVTLYLRVAEEDGASLGAEVLVHQMLRQRGARVPEVVHFEPHNDALGRSVMAVTEIPGRPISDGGSASSLATALVDAGRDLAVINSIGVDGFGWVKRDQPAPSHLAAAHADHRAFALDGLEQHLAVLRGRLLTGAQIELIERAIADHIAWLDTPRASLAHGDLDTTHIYHAGGDYSGIIDFGEIRGADRLYDLGHFALHDGEFLPDSALPYLLVGYRDVVPLPPDHLPRIQLQAILIGVRALARAAHRPRGAYQAHLAGAILRAATALDG